MTKTYYDAPVVDSSVMQDMIRGAIDAVVTQLLGVQSGSATIKFIFKYFGPVGTLTIFQI